ncbi:hypothetical protein [Azospirillum sp. A39]|uniref:hypothetical protein n=1 Tax=Azospirillum sp. A39 TaxID=3462279 RepID=UPI004045D398
MTTSSLAADVGAVAALLKDPFARAETAFLEIGERLVSAADTLSALTATFEGLPRRLEEEDVREAIAHLETVSREAAGMAEALGGERALLDRLTTLNVEVAARVVRLRKTVGIINVLAVNARIAATHIRTDGQDFSVFTTEIGRLGRAAAATIDRFATQHETLLGLLRAAGAKHAAFADRHAETLRAIAGRLDAGLMAVAAHRAQAAGAAAEIGERSRRIAQGIGEAVMAMQIGDITRQRLEHVGHAVAVLAGGLDPAAAGPAGGGAAEDWSAALPPDRRDLVAAAVCRLQSAQLAAASGEFEHEIARIATALAGLAGDARAIARLGADLYGAGGAADGSFLGCLAAELHQADALIKDCENARQAVDGLAASVTATLAELLRQVQAVQSVEVDMRLVGLNTALRCGRLGQEGRTLNVIAQELRGYANQTVADAQAVAEGLRAVAAAAGGLSVADGERGAGRIARLELAAASSLARLESVGEALAAALALLDREGERVSALLDETTARMTVREDVGRIMREALERLHRVAGAADGRASDVERVRREVLALVEGRYTMASERDVHSLFEAMLDGGPAAPPPAATAEPTDLDDVFF